MKPRYRYNWKTGEWDELLVPNTMPCYVWPRYNFFTGG